MGGRAGAGEKKGAEEKRDGRQACGKRQAKRAGRKKTGAEWTQFPEYDKITKCGPFTIQAEGKTRKNGERMP